ncbi:MAG: aspartate carbamoyltransferase [Bacillota bacterium]|nr:MAG: aspartate carbamoyltransferase [Bacillota bacterium]
MRHLLDITDLSVEEIEELARTAEDIAEHPERYADRCKGKKLVTLFFEPSTRTRMSFEAAMWELGGSVISCTDMSTSSVVKGETLADTMRVVANYADVVAMRHPYEGAAYVASLKSPVPVINAGDGGHCHPTQTLADLLTVHRELGRFDDLTVGLCGDLKYGRTVHSLINAMLRYRNVKFVLISPEELKLPDYELDALKKAGAPFEEVRDLESALPALDVLYMTRVQRERFDDAEAYERVKDCYVLNAEKLSAAKKDMIVMHPLPRVNEISADVDDDPRAAYFRQTMNGKLMRMALILKLLKEKALPSAAEKKTFVDGGRCGNKKCITRLEKLPQIYLEENGVKRCAYCEARRNP